MKPLFNIYLCLFASLLFIAACNDSDEEGITGFTIDTQEVTLGATGGMEPIKVASGTKWVAKVDKPWVKVMPANGVGSTNCEIVVDSTLSNDVRHAVVTFVPEGQPKQELKIHQTGYGKMIGLDKYEVEVPNMGNADKRYFDISVTTNVEFKVDYPLIGSWVTTTKRNPAIVIASTKLRSMTNWDASERLDYWLGVTVWEKTDKGVTPEQLGRVRSVEFRMLNTKEELPAEIGKIKYLETLVVYGNTNTMLLPSPYRIGNALAGLKYLRNLTISALGITTISKTELESSRKDLITLDLSGNNFTTIPYDLTPANFPGLLNLSLTGNRRYSTITDLSTETRDNPGLCIDASSSTLKNLLKWKNLKSLSLSYNLIYGKLPTFINSYNGSPEYGVSTYTDEDIQQNDTLMSASEEVKAKLKTIPNILPNAEHFSINLNFLTGDDLPDWLLYHPRFARFDPFTLIYTQDSGKDKSGNIPGFKNEPSNLEWFYERYPKARPTLTDN